MRYHHKPPKKYSAQSKLMAKLVRKFVTPQYFIPLLIVLGFIFHKAVTSLVILAGLIGLGAFSVFYRRFVYFNLGFELVTFFTVVICFAYNPLVGIVASIIMLILAAFITGRICIHLLIRIIVYTLMCLIAALMIGGSMVTAGKVITIVMNIMFFVIYLFMYGFNPADIFPIFANVFINFLLFNKFGELLMKLMM